jgi:hypothetical protein
MIGAAGIEPGRWGYRAPAPKPGGPREALRGQCSYIGADGRQRITTSSAPRRCAGRSNDRLGMKQPSKLRSSYVRTTSGQSSQVSKSKRLLLALGNRWQVVPLRVSNRRSADSLL